MRRAFLRATALVAVTVATSALLGAASARTPRVQPFPAHAVADYQLGGAYRPADDVTVVVRDRSVRSDPERYSVCYVNAFQTQPGSLSWWASEHPRLLLRDGRGRLVRDPDWPDEVLLDLRGTARRAELADVHRVQARGCAQRGYEALEPDNLDSWTRSRGLLTRSQTVAAARTLVAVAHHRGLAVAQKNTPELDGRRLGFDFAIAEECEVYRECGAYLSRYGSRVTEIEYTDNGLAAFERACDLRAGRHPIELRDRELLPAGRPGHVDRHC